VKTSPELREEEKRQRIVARERAPNYQCLYLFIGAESLVGRCWAGNVFVHSMCESGISLQCIDRSLVVSFQKPATLFQCKPCADENLRNDDLPYKLFDSLWIGLMIDALLIENDLGLAIEIIVFVTNNAVNDVHNYSDKNLS